ncbi:PfkB family carbohydrate kinase [Microbacterium sp. KUDC0406]|uniref:1-phosphofructokinase family hexose kinase n=1 Tax=Microbacterium sp. KUDC0406 TaxID=2909588 RepID=UPI001F368DA3|nr:PfkB family carbohydrate kinase [Microbacterium sp. KUDC0406]UJP09444.1 PfkB family carbohydrate kinase [Microbacterium sp. KUDC0406]
MIVTVTPNPALDLTWHVEKIVPGGTHRADAGAARAGGKGLNVARVAQAASAEVVAVTTVGGATGEEFRAELTAAGVPAVLVPVTAATRRSIALVDEALGDTTIVNERGIAPTDAEWDALRAAVSRSLSEGVCDSSSASRSLSEGVRDSSSASRSLSEGVRDSSSAPGSLSEGARDRDETLSVSPEALRPAPLAGRPEGQRPVLVISGSVPPGTPDDLLPSLIALGREAGAIVIADTSGPALLSAADAGADVLKPNAAELAEATGITDPIEGAHELLRRGASLILLSRGAEGMLAVSADADVVSARLPEALAGNPTGAGDAAVSAAAVLLASGIRDPEAILRRATAWSAAAVLMPLAGDIHPSWPELEAAVIITRETPFAARDPRQGAASDAEPGVSIEPDQKDTA